MSILFLRLLSFFPLPVLHGLGIFLGWAVWLASGRQRAQIRKNLQQSGLAASHPSLLFKAINETGKGLIELAAIWLRPQERVVGLVRRVSGWEVFRSALGTGRGVVLLAPHVGCFEILNLYIAAHNPLTSMYRPARQETLDRLMLKGRERGRARLVPTDLSGVKSLLGALRRGEAVGVLPDHVASRGDGVWAPFFGRWAYTPTLTARLIQSTGAVPLMVYAERLPWGRGYHIHFEPLSSPLPKDSTAAAAALNREIERIVRALPAQYMWNYNRYKKPGGAEPPPAHAPQ